MDSEPATLSDPEIILAGRLLAVTDVALAHLDLDALLDALLSRIQVLLGVDISVILMRESAEVLAVRAAAGMVGMSLAGEVPADHGLTGQIVTGCQAVAVASIGPTEAELLPPPFQERGLRSVLGVPLIVAGNVTGVLYVGGRQHREFPPEEAHLLQLAADRAALAIENARVHRETKAALATREAFLSIASHELRTPLTTLKGFLQLAQRRLRQEEPERAAQFLAWADQQADRLDELIGLLLSAAGLASDRPVAEYQLLNLVDLVQRVVAVAEAANSDHPVSLVLPSQPVWLLGSASQLEQVLTNLLSNARKYSAGGTPIHVGVHLLEDWVEVAITDEGIGIPPEEQAVIFERFHRASNVDPGVSGLGLGLFVSRQIIAGHGGTMTVASHPGHGSTFTVRLPRRSPETLTRHA